MKSLLIIFISALFLGACANTTITPTTSPTPIVNSSDSDQDILDSLSTNDSSVDQDLNDLTNLLSST